MKGQKNLRVGPDKPLGYELIGAVGEYTARIERGGGWRIYHKEPFAIVGMTVTPWPSEDNAHAVINIRQLHQPAIVLPVCQVQKRRVWPTLLFFAGGVEVAVSALALQSPVELRLQWEAILP